MIIKKEKIGKKKKTPVAATPEEPETQPLVVVGQLENRRDSKTTGMTSTRDSAVTLFNCGVFTLQVVRLTLFFFFYFHVAKKRGDVAFVFNQVSSLYPGVRMVIKRVCSSAILCVFCEHFTGKYDSLLF